jgi:anti-sigma factor RsiW
MTCAEASDRILDRVYGELAESERAAFEAHLAACDGCRGELETMERTRRTARLALDGPLSEPAPERVRREVLAAAELAVRQRGMVPAAAAAGVSSVLRSGGPKGRASQADPTGGWWGWLRRPWVLPAFATVSLLAIFFIARPAIIDGPKQVLEAPLDRAAPAATPASAPVPAPEPLLAVPPGAPAATGELKGAGGLGQLDEDKSDQAPPADGRARAGLADRVRGDDDLARPARSRRSAERLQAERSLARAPAPRAPAAANRYAQPPPQAKPGQPRMVVRPALDEERVDELPKAEQQAPIAAAAEPPPPPPAARAEADSARFQLESRAKKMAPRAGADLALGFEAEGKSAGAGAGARARQAGPPAPPAAAAPAAPAAMPAEAEAVASAAAPAKERAASLEPLPVILERADRAFTEGRWQVAADAYRDLLRRFASDARAREWTRRRDVSLANLRRSP